LEKMGECISNVLQSWGRKKQRGQFVVPTWRIFGEPRSRRLDRRSTSGGGEVWKDERITPLSTRGKETERKGRKDPGNVKMGMVAKIKLGGCGRLTG